MNGDRCVTTVIAIKRKDPEVQAADWKDREDWKDAKRRLPGSYAERKTP